MSGSSEQLNKFIKQFIILKTKKDVKDLLTKHEKLFLSDEEARQRLIAHIEDSLDSSEKTYIVLANIVYCLEFFLQVVTEGRTQDATRVRESHTVELIIFLKRTYIALDLLHTVSEL